MAFWYTLSFGFVNEELVNNMGIKLLIKWPIESVQIWRLFLLK